MPRRKNPLADLLGGLLADPRAAARGVEVLVRHRGAPGGVRVVPDAAIARAAGTHLALLDGSELPLHRVVEVRAGGDVLWRRRDSAEGAARPPQRASGKLSTRRSTGGTVRRKS